MDLTRGRRKRRVFGGRLIEGHAVVGVVGMGLVCLSNKFDRLGRLKYVLCCFENGPGSRSPPDIQCEATPADLTANFRSLSIYPHIGR